MNGVDEEYQTPHVPAQVAEVVRIAVEPVRAWLSCLNKGEISWRMFLEGSLSTADLIGSFSELVERAVVAGAEELHVWSLQESTYTQFDSTTVRIPD